jgi:hypothetical protein
LTAGFTTTLFHIILLWEGVSLYKKLLKMNLEVTERNWDRRESKYNKFLTTGIDNNEKMTLNKGVDTPSLSEFKIQLQEFSGLLKRTETILNNFDYNVGHLLLPHYDCHFI